MHHLHVVLGEKALLDEVSQPPRGRYELHALWWQHGEQAFLLLKRPAHRSIRRNGFGVCPFLRARSRCSATSLPLHALHVREVDAVPRERPAIVQRPNHLTAVSGQPLEQHLDIDVVAQKEMQMHHVGVYLVQFAEEPARDRFGVETGLAIQARLQHVQANLGIACNALQALILFTVPAGPEHPRLVTSGHKLAVLLKYNRVGPAARVCVYLDVFQARLSSTPSCSRCRYSFE